MSVVYEYRVTARRGTPSARAHQRREDVGGAGSPFRSDEPMWQGFGEGELRGVEGLCQALLEEAVALGHEDVRIERRVVGPWEPYTFKIGGTA